MIVEQPAFDVTVTRDGETVTVAVHGEVDLSTCETLEKALSEAMVTPAARVVVDVDEVGFLDSTGVRALIAGWRQAEARQLSFEVRNASPQLLKIFRVTGVADVFGLSA